MGLESELGQVRELVSRRYQQDRQESLRTAVKILDDAIKRDPANYSAHTHRAFALNELGNHAGALSSLDFVLGRIDEWAFNDTDNEVFSSVHNNRGYALLWMGRPQEAMAEFEISIKALSESPEVRLHKGDKYRSVLTTRVHVATANRLMGNIETAKSQYLAVLNDLGTAFIFGDRTTSAVIGVRAEHGLKALGYDAGNTWTKPTLECGVVCQDFIDSLK